MNNKIGRVKKTLFHHLFHSVIEELNSNPVFQNVPQSEWTSKKTISELRNVMLSTRRLGSFQRAHCQRFARAVCMLAVDNPAYQQFLRSVAADSMTSVWDIQTVQADRLFHASPTLRPFLFQGIHAHLVRRRKQLRRPLQNRLMDVIDHLLGAIQKLCQALKTARYYFKNAYNPIV